MLVELASTGASCLVAAVESMPQKQVLALVEPDAATSGTAFVPMAVVAQYLVSWNATAHVSVT